MLLCIQQQKQKTTVALKGRITIVSGPLEGEKKTRNL